jgi:DHA1 family bicyclomycin/chloramphenicol resistance-like MFS transporter
MSDATMTEARSQPAMTLWRTVLLAAMTAFPPMAIDQYLPALPIIGKELRASPGQVQWTLSIFFIFFSLGQLFYGPVSDRLGRRLPLLAGVLLFIAASAGCATAGSIEALILWRAVQALGAAAGSVVARAMVRDLHEGTAAARMLSLMSLIMAIAPLAAPILGGYLTVWLDWQSNFWALGLFGLLCLAGAAFGLPETLPPARRRRANIVGMLQGYGLLLRSRRFLGYALSNGISFGGYFAYVSGSPFVFIELYAVPTALYGYLFAINIVGMMIGSALNSRLVGRFGIDRMLAQGLGIGAVAGVALLGLGLTGAGGLPALFLALFLFVSTQNVISANAMAGALSARPDLAGTAAALAGVGGFLVGALAGGLVNQLADGSALPMAAVVAMAAFGAVAVERLLVTRPGTTPAG